MRFPSSALLASLALTSLVPFATGCAAGPDDDSSETTGASEDALTSLPTGHYALVRAPSRGSYVKSLTLAAGKRFEMDYVRVRETTEPWAWNPWVPVPVRKEETLSLRGTYFLYDADGKQRVSFDSEDRGFGQVDFTVTVASGRMTLQGFDGAPFALASRARPVDDTAPFVAACKAREWDATLRLDQSERRRGTLTVDRRSAGATGSTPLVGRFDIAYTGGTGVDDYMAFEGRDAGDNAVSFAIRKADIGKTSGTFQVGLGYERDLTGYEVHHTLACTIAR